MILSPPPLQPRPGLLSATVLPSARRCPVQRLHSAAKTRIGVTKQEEYNANMKRQMNWDNVNPYEYHPERGLYWHEILPNLLCGSQPQSAGDIDILHSEMGVTDIVSLQQDKDLDYWGVNLHELMHQAEHRQLKYRRCPAQDFDPHSLRTVLPLAASHIHQALSRKGRAYVHCTAGLGRAPAACIAYMFWFRDMELVQATQHLTDMRPCGPKTDAIRGATFDLLDGRHFDEFAGLPPISYSILSPEQRQEVQHRVASIAT